MVQACLQNAHNIEYPNPSPVSADQIPNDTEQQPQSVEPESPSVERLSTPPSRVDPLEITENPNDEACATNALERVRKREAYRGRCRRGEYEERQYTDHSNGSRPPNRRKRRRMEYARVQELWKRNPSRVAEEVIDGACRDVKHQLEEMEAYWRPLLERVSSASGPTPEALDRLRSSGQYGGNVPDFSTLWHPFTASEVKQAKVNLKSIFVPKKEVSAGPSEYRPISIASIPLRHLHTLLARRLLASCPPDVRQRGFICADGTLEYAAVLDAVLGDCRKRLRECHVAVLDFSKAFETVSHVALIDLLRQRGLPGPFCDYLARLYQSATTHLAVSGRTSSPVKVGRGVRQGDPLSPILFNMAMDLVLAALPKDIGYRLEGERVSALAFADNLVLVAGSKMGMQEAISCVEKSSGLMGLRLNHSKSPVLSMVPDGHRKKHHYLSERTFRMGGRLIRQVTCVERWRYLVVEFEATGSTTLEGGINEALKNISKAPLKPQQRLQILRAHLIPKFLHGLVLGQVRDNRVRMLDEQIREAVRMAVAASKSERIQKKLRWSKRQLLKYSRDDPFGPSPSVRAYWRQSLHASVDGFELREAGRTPASTKWMRERCHGISGRDFVQFVLTHINALSSRVRNSRGRRVGRESELNCRALCMVRETTAHVIQQCHRTHGGREKGWLAIEEPKIKTLRGLRKPDLIASKDDTGVIVDAQVAGLLGLPNVNAVTATSCTVSWRGIWSPRSYNELSSLLGIDKRSIAEIPVIALRGSHMNWGRFNRMTTVSAVGSADRASSDQ
ncbi:unnamed protein product [Pieris macdunnoughi]|uniref:Reverse transcriptase domain-containing protein n=1 Tax=Pieris macdunnoughi TaxID=345717 RepID=A0A821XUS0_9NEOP|nr:unnamed protein product [Pieris macdunnoughi]